MRCVLVPVMDVGVVRVGMGHGRVMVWMNVAIDRLCAGCVFVPMMLVVRVRMLVIGRCMQMFVAVSLGRVEIQPDTGCRRGEPRDGWRSFVQQ